MEWDTMAISSLRVVSQRTGNPECDLAAVFSTALPLIRQRHLQEVMSTNVRSHCIKLYLEIRIREWDARVLPRNCLAGLTVCGKPASGRRYYECGSVERILFL